MEDGKKPHKRPFSKEIFWGLGINNFYTTLKYSQNQI